MHSPALHQTVGTTNGLQSLHQLPAMPYIFQLLWLPHLCLLSLTWLLYSAWTHGQDISLGRELLRYLGELSHQLPSSLLSSVWT